MKLEEDAFRNMVDSIERIKTLSYIRKSKAGRAYLDGFEEGYNNCRVSLNKEREKLGLPSIDTSVPGFHLINKNISRTQSSIASTFDEFFTNCLKPYGITLANSHQYVNRILVEELRYPNNSAYDMTYHRVYLDGEYLFTIRTMTYLEIRSGNYSIQTSCQQIKEQEEDIYGRADERSTV